jgi:hypothetical protein
LRAHWSRFVCGSTTLQGIKDKIPVPWHGHIIVCGSVAPPIDTTALPRDRLLNTAKEPLIYRHARAGGHPDIFDFPGFPPSRERRNYRFSEFP